MLALSPRSEVEKLPVTILSGFLGSGKTTLLKHVLETRHDMRVALIVNDMAELNIDATLVKNGSLVQTEEKLVEMQNGCICCTLREDLLIEVSKLAQMRKFDYLLIESTGIGEPQQVAETFAIPNEDGATLDEISSIDTMVTVVDSANLRSNLASIKTLADQEGKDVVGGERNVSDLLLDQIEFANVILLNKIDLVPEEEAETLKAFLQQLNPGAEVLPCVESKIPIDKIIHTKAFDLEKASKSAGWLQSLTEEHVPETLEYGIASFVYRARRPFHPQRIWSFLTKYFCLQEMIPMSHDDVDDPMDAENDPGFELRTQPISDKKSQKMQQLLYNEFGQVLRSKGFIWLAGRDDLHGELSQAGATLRISPGNPWFASVPEDMWEGVDKEEVKKDFEGDHGDRRQEIVFIGIDVKKEKLSMALDSCLCSTSEFENEKYIQDCMKDCPFLKWPQIEFAEVTVSTSTSLTQEGSMEVELISQADCETGEANSQHLRRSARLQQR